MLEAQVLVVRDSWEYLIKQEQPIIDYVIDLFDKAAKKVAELNPLHLDLLVINSPEVFRATLSSSSHFENYLNASLAKMGRREYSPIDSPIRMTGRITDHELARYLKEQTKERQIKLNFLSQDRPGTSNVLYYLLADKEK